MSDEMEMVAWLRAQLDEDERVALHAGGRHWRREAYSCVVDAADSRLIVYGEGTPSSEQAEHIALHDPARVLREVEAKRRILDLHRPVADSSWPEPGHCLECCSLESQDYRKYPCPTVRLLALPYSDRPGYQERWRP